MNAKSIVERLIGEGKSISFSDYACPWASSREDVVSDVRKELGVPNDVGIRVRKSEHEDAWDIEITGNLNDLTAKRIVADAKKLGYTPI